MWTEDGSRKAAQRLFCLLHTELYDIDRDAFTGVSAFHSAEAPPGSFVLLPEVCTH